VVVRLLLGIRVGVRCLKPLVVTWPTGEGLIGIPTAAVFGSSVGRGIGRVGGDSPVSHRHDGRAIDMNREVFG
jgi:hypothetical protein